MVEKMLSTLAGGGEFNAYVHPSLELSATSLHLLVPWHTKPRVRRPSYSLGTGDIRLPPDAGCAHACRRRLSTPAPPRHCCPHIRLGSIENPQALSAVLQALVSCSIDEQVELLSLLIVSATHSLLNRETISKHLSFERLVGLYSKVSLPPSCLSSKPHGTSMLSFPQHRTISILETAASLSVDVSDIDDVYSI